MTVTKKNVREDIYSSSFMPFQCLNTWLRMTYWVGKAPAPLVAWHSEQQVVYGPLSRMRGNALLHFPVFRLCFLIMCTFSLGVKFHTLHKSGISCCTGGAFLLLLESSQQSCQQQQATKIFLVIKKAGEIQRHDCLVIILSCGCKLPHSLHWVENCTDWMRPQEDSHRTCREKWTMGVSSVTTQ